MIASDRLPLVRESWSEPGAAGLFGASRVLTARTIRVMRIGLVAIARMSIDALKTAGYGWGNGSWGGYLDKLPEIVTALEAK